MTKRAILSCDLCRSRKVRCSKDRHCSNCRAKGVPCTWEESDEFQRQQQLIQQGIFPSPSRRSSLATSESSYADDELARLSPLPRGQRLSSPSTPIAFTSVPATKSSKTNEDEVSQAEQISQLKGTVEILSRMLGVQPAHMIQLSQSVKGVSCNVSGINSTPGSYTLPSSAHTSPGMPEYLQISGWDSTRPTPLPTYASVAPLPTTGPLSRATSSSDYDVLDSLVDMSLLPTYGLTSTELLSDTLRHFD